MTAAPEAIKTTADTWFEVTDDYNQTIRTIPEDKNQDDSIVNQIRASMYDARSIIQFLPESYYTILGLQAKIDHIRDPNKTLFTGKFYRHKNTDLCEAWLPLSCTKKTGTTRFAEGWDTNGTHIKAFLKAKFPTLKEEVKEEGAGTADTWNVFKNWIASKFGSPSDPTVDVVKALTDYWKEAFKIQVWECDWRQCKRRKKAGQFCLLHQSPGGTSDKFQNLQNTIKGTLDTKIKDLKKTDETAGLEHVTTEITEEQNFTAVKTASVLEAFNEQEKATHEGIRMLAVLLNKIEVTRNKMITGTGEYKFVKRFEDGLEDYASQTEMKTLTELSKLMSTLASGDQSQNEALADAANSRRETQPVTPLYD